MLTPEESHKQKKSLRAPLQTDLMELQDWKWILKAVRSKQDLSCVRTALPSEPQS